MRRAAPCARVRTLAWLSKCRAILVRWDKQDANFLSLPKLTCARICSAATTASRTHSDMRKS
jgi:hypothetical protein